MESLGVTPEIKSRLVISVSSYIFHVAIAIYLKCCPQGSSGRPGPRTRLRAFSFSELHTHRIRSLYAKGREPPVVRLGAFLFSCFSCRRPHAIHDDFQCVQRLTVMTTPA
jgi:hypothetical protein